MADITPILQTIADELSGGAADCSALRHIPAQEMTAMLMRLRKTVRQRADLDCDVKDRVLGYIGDALRRLKCE